MDEHQLSSQPLPRGEQPLYVNEPWIIDRTREPEDVEDLAKFKQPEPEADNVRVYVPLDLNRRSILRRLADVIERNEPASEQNEFDFSWDVQLVLSQLTIYDQFHLAKSATTGKEKHSAEGIALAEAIVARLEQVRDAGAECFPFEEIAQLQEEFGL